MNPFSKHGKKGLLSLVLSVFFVPLVSIAAVGAAETYTLPSGSRIDENAYLAGGTVIISGPIAKDAVVAGGNVTFSSVVEGDTILAAGSGELLGSFKGDVRALGGMLTVADTVGGDVSIAGGVVSLLADSRVSGDVLVVGGKLSLLGTVEGTVYLAGGDIFIDGKIVGNVRLYSAGDVHIGKNAVIGGDLIYHSAREAIIEPGAVIKGKTQFTYAPPFVSAPDLRGFFAGLFGALFVTRLLVLLVAGLLFVLVFRRASGSLARVSQESFWKHALVGLAVLVAVPFASLVLALTIFGGLVAAMLFALWIFMLLVAQVYAGVVAARIFEVYVLKRTPGHLVSWQAAVLGILGLNVACLVPFVGLFICLLFLLVALGSLSYLGYRQFLLAR